MGFLFIVATIWSIFAKKDLLFMILLMIGVTAKENVIFVAPLYYTFNSQKLLDIKVLFRSLYLVAPALVILFLLRIFIVPTNSDYYNVMYLLEHIGWPRIQQLSADSLLSYSTGTFGVSLIFLPLFAVKRNLSLLWRFLPFIILTYISLLFAVNTERLLVSAFPAFLIMALYGIKNIADKTGVHEEAFIPLPLLLLVLLLIKKDWWVARNLYESFILLALLAFSFQQKWLVVSKADKGGLTRRAMDGGNSPH
jgi:hypothetical protein